MQDYYQKWQNEMIRNNIIGKQAIIPVSGADIVMEYRQIISLFFIGDTGIRIMLLQDVTLQWWDIMGDNRIRHQWEMITVGNTYTKNKWLRREQHPDNGT